MAEWNRALEQVKLAYANVAQLKQITQDIEAIVTGDPEAAGEFIRPCTQLLQKLLEAQGSVETLLEKLFVAGRVEMAGRR
jgi:hypothetical protein